MKRGAEKKTLQNIENKTLKQTLFRSRAGSLLAQQRDALHQPPTPHSFCFLVRVGEASREEKKKKKDG